ncbi:hypothetical protein R6Z07F_006268 [Ovis aries]
MEAHGPALRSAGLRAPARGRRPAAGRGAPAEPRRAPRPESHGLAAQRRTSEHIKGRRSSRPGAPEPSVDKSIHQALTAGISAPSQKSSKSVTKPSALSLLRLRAAVEASSEDEEWTGRCAFPGRFEVRIAAPSKGLSSSPVKSGWFSVNRGGTSARTLLSLSLNLGDVCHQVWTRCQHMALGATGQTGSGPHSARGVGAAAAPERLRPQPALFENASPAISIAAAVAPMTDCTHWVEKPSPSSLESLGAAPGRPASLSRVDVTFANSQDASCLRAKPACGSPGQGALVEGLCVCRVELD